MTIYDLPKREHLKKYPEIECRNSESWFEVRQLPGNVIAIAEPKHEQNGCFYLLPGRDSALLFDTGLGIFDPRPLVEELYPGKITVVNSHFHFDHTGGNHRFDECHLYMDDLVKKVAAKGLFSDVIKEQVNDKCFPLGVPEGFDQASYGTRPFPAVSTSEGEIFDLGDRKFRVIEAPGHSQDGIVLFSEDENLMLAGDIFYFGALYGQFASDDFGYSDLESYRRTMHKLSSVIKPDTRVLCSHNAFEASGIQIAEAAALFDELLDNRSEGTSVEDMGYDYGDSGEIKQIFGNGFSIMYT